MKHIFKYLAGACLAGFAAASCTPEKFEGADQNGKPTVEGINISVEVDPETNVVTMSSPHLLQSYPVWSIPAVRTAEGETDFYSTLENTSRLFALAGEKKVIYRVGNRNGFSDAAIEKTVTIKNSLKDLNGIAKALTSEEGKQWRVAREEEAHLGYGPKGGDGSGTWVAEADSKAELALYDDFVKFKSGSADGNFLYSGEMSYNPGDDAKVQFGGVAEADRKDAAAQDGCAYKITVEGDDVLLTLAPQTLMPFVPSDEFLAKPVFRIDSYSGSLLTLVANDGDKAWRLVLTSEDFGGGDLGWGGFEGDGNLLKDASPVFRFWFANSSWGQIDDPVHEGNLADGFSLTMNETGKDQWQAQLHVEETGVQLASDKTYDFSVVITYDGDTEFEATVKPQMAGDDNTFFSDARHKIAKGSNVIALSDCAGFDGEFKIAFDFAGAPAGAVITISKVFLSEHDAANVVPFDYNDPDNLWRTEVEEKDAYSVEFWWANASWAQIANPGFEVKRQKKGSNLYTITAPDATASQWQAQNTFVTGMTATMDDVVDFSCIIVPNTDLAGVTVKFTEANVSEAEKHDNNFFFAERVDLKANVPNVVKFTDTKLPMNDAHAMNLIFDLGGNPEGAVVKITDIVVIKK